MYWTFVETRGCVCRVDGWLCALFPCSFFFRVSSFESIGDGRMDRGPAVKCLFGSCFWFLASLPASSSLSFSKVTFFLSGCGWCLTYALVSDFIVVLLKESSRLPSSLTPSFLLLLMLPCLSGFPPSLPSPSNRRFKKWWIST